MHTHVAYASRTILDSFSQGQKEMILPEYQTKPLTFSEFCIMEVIQQHSLNLSRFQWNPVCTVVTISPTIPPDSSLEFVQLCFAGIGWRKNWQKEISGNVHMSWNMLGNWIKIQMKISKFYITDLYHRRGLFNIQNVWTNR